MKLQQIKDTIHANTLSVKHGVYTARWEFFYTHGATVEGKIARIMKAFPQAQIVDSDEIWKPFRGGASTANSSHWMVKFTLDGSSVVTA